MLILFLENYTFLLKYEYIDTLEQLESKVPAYDLGSMDDF